MPNKQGSAVPLQAQDRPSPFFQGRLRYDSISQISLQPFRGNQFCAADDVNTIPAGGILLARTDNLLTSTGADAGSSMAVSTLYYVYLGSRSAGFGGGQLRLSATAPTVGVDGIAVLSTSGDGPYWLHIGFAFSNSSQRFQFNQGLLPADPAVALIDVVNVYNQIPIPFRTKVGGYTDSGSDHFFIMGANANIAAVNGGALDFANFIADGVNSIQLSGAAFIDGTTNGVVKKIAPFAVGIGYGVDSASAQLMMQGPFSIAVTPAGALGIASGACAFAAPPLTAGRYFVVLNGANESEATEIYADVRVHGATNHWAGTWIGGTVMG